MATKPKVLQRTAPNPKVKKKTDVKAVKAVKAEDVTPAVDAVAVVAAAVTALNAVSAAKKAVRNDQRVAVTATNVQNVASEVSVQPRVLMKGAHPAQSEAVADAIKPVAIHQTTKTTTPLKQAAKWVVLKTRCKPRLKCGLKHATNG